MADALVFKTLTSPNSRPLSRSGVGLRAHRTGQAAGYRSVSWRVTLSRAYERYLGR
jgi:hypothetical protein